MTGFVQIYLKKSNNDICSLLRAYYYESIGLPDNQLILTQFGSYYRINLKNICTSKIFFFEGGEYLKSTFNNDFGIGLNKLLRDIQKIKDRGVNFKIYTLGRADLTGEEYFEKELKEPLKINVYPEISENRFQLETREVKIPKLFKNEHLPNLRANFIKQKIEQHPTKFKAKILEGKVIQEYDETFRNTTIIVFIEDWKLDN